MGMMPVNDMHNIWYPEVSEYGSETPFFLLPLMKVMKLL